MFDFLDEEIIKKNPTEEAGEHLSRTGDYMRHTKNAELKKSLDENREGLNEIIAKIEIASGLDPEEILAEYSSMSGDLNASKERLSEALRKIPIDKEDGFEIDELVGRLMNTNDKDQIKILVAALLISVILKGDEDVLGLSGK